MQTTKATYSVWTATKKSTAKKMADYKLVRKGLTFHEAIVTVWAQGQNEKIVECFFSIDGVDFVYEVHDTDTPAELAHVSERFRFNFDLARERTVAGMWI